MCALCRRAILLQSSAIYRKRQIFSAGLHPLWVGEESTIWRDFRFFSIFETVANRDFTRFHNYFFIPSKPLQSLMIRAFAHDFIVINMV